MMIISRRPSTPWDSHHAERRGHRRQNLCWQSWWSSSSQLKGSPLVKFSNSEDGSDPIVCLWNIINSLNFCFVSFRKIWRFLEGQVLIYFIIGDQTLQMKIKQIIPSSFHTKAQSFLSRKLRLFELCQVPDCQVQFLSSFSLQILPHEEIWMPFHFYLISQCNFLKKCFIIQFWM